MFYESEAQVRDAKFCRDLTKTVKEIRLTHFTETISSVEQKITYTF